jgi:hypothetical protein
MVPSPYTLKNRVPARPWSPNVGLLALANMKHLRPIAHSSRVVRRVARVASAIDCCRRLPFDPSRPAFGQPYGAHRPDPSLSGFTSTPEPPHRAILYCLDRSSSSRMGPAAHTPGQEGHAMPRRIIARSAGLSLPFNPSRCLEACGRSSSALGLGSRRTRCGPTGSE